MDLYIIFRSLMLLFDLRDNKYRILPNTRPRGALVFKSKSIDVERLRGIPELAVGRFHSNRHNSTTGHRKYLFLLSLSLNTLDIQFI